MAGHKYPLSDIFDELDDNEFGKFQWHLHNEGVIKKVKLDKANREQTIDAMVQTYNGDEVLEVTNTILEKMQRNDLLKNISNSGSDSDSKGASATQAMTQEDKSASEKLWSGRNVFIQGVSGANVNLLLDELLRKNVINDAEMESVRGESLTSGKARAIVDMVRKKGNKACSKMIDIVGQLDAELGERLHQPSPADLTDRPTLSGMTLHNRFTGAGSTLQKPPEMNRMNESESKVINVHIHNTVSASNERSGMPLPTLANASAAGYGVTKQQVKLAAKRMENMGMLVHAKNNGTPSYKVAKGKKSVKKHDAAKKPAFRNPAAKKPIANKPAVKANAFAAGYGVTKQQVKLAAKRMENMGMLVHAKNNGTPSYKVAKGKKSVKKHDAAKKPAFRNPAANKPIANKPAVKKSAAKTSKKVTKIPKKATKKAPARKPPAKPKAVKPRKATSKKK